MIIIPHMLVGAAIGRRVRNIWLVFIFGLISHCLLDFLPHWDYLLRVEITNIEHLIKIGLDFILGASIIFILIRSCSKKWLVLVGIIAALLPDFLNFIYYNFGFQWLEPLIKFHHTIHYWQGLSFWQGFPAGLSVSLLAIIVFALLNKNKLEIK